MRRKIIKTKKKCTNSKKYKNLTSFSDVYFPESKIHINSEESLLRMRQTKRKVFYRKITYNRYMLPLYYFKSNTIIKMDK